MSVKLRYDGLYATDFLEGDYRDYLRFYADGDVISALSSGTPAQVNRWLYRDHEDKHFSSGVYRRQGLAGLEFRLVEPDAELEFPGRQPFIDYQGELFPDSLTLTLYSHLTDHSSTREYHFEPL